MAMGASGVSRACWDAEICVAIVIKREDNSCFGQKAY